MITTSFIVILSLSLTVLYLVYYFIFNIYEIEVSADSKELKPDNNSVTKISIKPINSLGKEVPFRKVNSEIKFISGIDLVTIVSNEDRIIILKTKNKKGLVKIEIDSKFSLLLNVIEINII